MSKKSLLKATSTVGHMLLRIAVVMYRILSVEYGVDGGPASNAAFIYSEDGIRLLEKGGFFLFCFFHFHF